MALIQFGIAVSDARGKLGGVVFSRNRNGAYVRRGTTPVNPNTVAQQERRDQVMDLSTAWRDLTEAERAGWENLGDQITRVNKVGNTYTLTGLQAFQSINQNRFTNGAALVTTAPILDNPVNVSSITLDASGGALTLEILALPVAGSRNYIYATPPLSAGRNFFGPSEYRLIQIQSGVLAANPLDIEAGYEAVFGAGIIAASTNAKISVLLKPVSPNYIAGATLRADAIIL